MHSARFDRSLQVQPVSGQPTKSATVPKPNAHQAAAYIRDMSASMRNLAAEHQLTTLALLLEMASVEAGSI
jgi:hypothetical protein